MMRRNAGMFLAHETLIFLENLVLHFFGLIQSITMVVVLKKQGGSET
jgi:hypothetical protein